MSFNSSPDPLAPRETDALQDSIAQLARRIRILEAVIAPSSNRLPQPISPLSVGDPGHSYSYSRDDHVHPGAFDADTGRAVMAPLFTTYSTHTEDTEAAIETTYSTEVEP